MRSHSRLVIGSVIGVGILMIFLLGFHFGGEALFKVANFSPLLGAFIGGTLVLVCVNLPLRQEEDVEPWLGRERFAWILIGCACVAWAIGESFWRYYESLGQNPFPSLADVGYASFPPLVFWGLILLPFSRIGHRRVFFLLDSLIATGALLSIAWFLLLGSLTQTPTESQFAKVLGLYYPTMDTALVSCTVFLLLRGIDPVNHASARRISLILAGLGLFVFASSDFLFNVLENKGIYMEGTWVDLGWPLGIMALGVAAYLRRFLPTTSSAVLEQQLKQRARQLHFGPAQSLPYLLLALLFCVLVFNVLSSDTTQLSIRPVLIVATLIVVGLVITRQILTIQENGRLMHEQVRANHELEQVYQDIANRQADLEEGVSYLKEIQTRLANGDMRARANMIRGDLWPLASGLNLMADRMMRSEQRQKYAQQIITAIGELSQALERSAGNRPFVLPASCLYAPPELHQLLLAIGLKPAPGTSHSVPHPTPPRPGSSPLSHIPETPDASFHRRPSASPLRRWNE